MTKAQPLSELIIEGIRNRKGKSITIIDLSEIDGASTDKFIICQGSSNMQVSAIADSIREYVQETSGIKPYSYDGYRNSQWIIIDYGDIMAHVFTPDTRQFYNLEELWSDAPVRDLPDED